MTIGIAAYLTVKELDGATVVARYQNYWANQTVDNHDFYPFASDALVSNTSGGQTSLTLTFALSANGISLIENALASNYLIQVEFFSFSPTTDNSVPTSKALITSYLGEVIAAQQDSASLTVQLGSSLGAVEPQAPPRKFTTTLVGQPPKI